MIGGIGVMWLCVRSANKPSKPPTNTLTLEIIYGQTPLVDLCDLFP